MVTTTHERPAARLDRLTRQRRAVLAAVVGHGPVTADWLETHMDWRSPSGIRTALLVLWRAGVIRPYHKKRRTRFGNWARAWVVVSHEP